MKLTDKRFRYHNSSSHVTSEGLRARFAAIDPLWNKAPRKRKTKKPVNVIPIKERKHG